MQIFKCNHCQGSGFVTCPKCDGAGCEDCFFYEGSIVCPECMGEGESDIGVCVHDFVSKRTKDGTLIKRCFKCGKVEE